MATAIETVSSAPTAGTLPRVASIAQLAEPTKFLPSLPDVIVTLGATPTPTLTYTAINTGRATPVAAEAATTPAGIITEALVTAAPASSNTVTLAETTSTADLPAAPDATLTNFLVDSGALARANITANPAYASAVASFYVSLVTPIRESASADALPNRMESVQPITAVSAASAIAQYSEQSSRDMSGRKHPQANGAARKH